jgi:predicted HD phosphohydrolase
MPLDRRPSEPLRLAPPRLGLRDAGTWLHWLDEAFASRPSRLWHSRAVWHRIAHARRHELRWLDGERFGVLELAALLHDVGRAIDPDDREPHALVGARFLDAIGLHDVAPIVAHHSGGAAEAADRGHTYSGGWPADPDPDLVALVTYVDRTTSPRGDSVTLEERRAELAARYGADAPQLRWYDQSLVDAHRGAQLFASGRISLTA